MSPKTGRPPKDNPRNCDINIRLTRKELDDIQFVANYLGISRTDSIVRAIELLKAEIKK